MPAQAYAFHSWLVCWVAVSEAVDFLEVVFRFILVLLIRVSIGLQVLVVALGVPRVNAAPFSPQFRFPEFVEEIDRIDKLLL